MNDKGGHRAARAAKNSTLDISFYKKKLFLELIETPGLPLILNGNEWIDGQYDSVKEVNFLYLFCPNVLEHFVNTMGGAKFKLNFVYSLQIASQMS